MWLLDDGELIQALLDILEENGGTIVLSSEQHIIAQVQHSKTIRLLFEECEEHEWLKPPWRIDCSQCRQALKEGLEEK